MSLAVVLQRDDAQRNCLSAARDVTSIQLRPLALMPSISIPYMHSIIANESFVCSRCIARSVRDRARARPQYARRTITTTPRRLEDLGGKHAAEEQPAAKQGAMSSRLEQMTEESLEEGGRGARKAIRDAGFSEELKRKLEARIAEDASRKLDPTASAVLSMPVSDSSSHFLAESR